MGGQKEREREMLGRSTGKLKERKEGIDMIDEQSAEEEHEARLPKGCETDSEGSRRLRSLGRR